MSIIAHDSTKENFYELFNSFREAESYASLEELIQDMKRNGWHDEAEEFMSELTEGELKSLQNAFHANDCHYDKVDASL